MKTIIVIIMTSVAYMLHAQSEVIIASINKDQIQLSVQIESGNTLYGLAKATGTSVADITHINRLSDNNLTVGSTLSIPLDKHKISTVFSELKNPRAINYTTLTGDNLYRVATTFGLTISTVLTLNGRSASDLQKGETLLLGWIEWPYNLGSSDTAQNITVPHGSDLKTKDVTSISIDPVPTLPDMLSDIRSDSPHQLSDYQLASIPQEQVEIKEQIKKERGIAFWEKSKYQQTDLIAMHPSAKVNSTISLYNPMLKKKVKAKVVAEMPEESYADDVSIVISPSVADALGALDRRFLVEITYVE